MANGVREGVMNTNCLDIGIIQAFLDGELAASEVTRVSDHIGDCDSCAMLLTQAEEENLIVFPALAREMDSLVPTQRLWTRINDSIIVEKAAAPWYQKLLGMLVSGFASPSVAIATGLLIVGGFFAIFLLNRPAAPIYDVAVNRPAAVNPERETREIVPVFSNNNDESANDRVAPSRRSAQPAYEASSYRTPRVKGEPAVYTTVAQRNSPLQDTAYVPGEESYVKTIASLNKSVGGDQDPNVMRASERVSYERDMAVVDLTIKKMRETVKKDPKNDAAKQMLSAAYQNKIDLLNSVAQKEELVASLR